MPFRPPTSRTRYRQYQTDLKNHETEGSRRSAAAHAKQKAGRQRSFMTLFRAFLGLVRPHRRAVIIALATVTVGTILKLIPPAVTGFVFDYALRDDVPLPTWAVDAGVPTEPQRILLAVGVLLIAIAVLTVSIGMWGRYLNTRTVKRVQSGVRRLMFAHAVRLPLHRVQELKSGGVTSVLREDAGGIGDLLFSMLYNPWRAIVQLVGTLIVLTIVDWRLLVGSLVLFPTVFLTHRTWIARIRPLFRDIRASRQNMDSHATESFGGMRVVRSFGRQRTETGRFIRNNHFMIRQELFAWWWSRGVDIAWSLLIPTATAVLLWYGGGRIVSDAARVAAGEITVAEALTVGDLVTFLFYLALLLEPLAMLAASATSFQNNLAGLDRVLDLLEEPKEFEDAPATSNAAFAIDGAVSLRNVSFCYPNTDTPVLEDISFDVKPGQTVALVGRSGAGKTTLCNLIARFYDPDDGVIEVDGTDIRTLDVERYRRQLGIVEQDIFLFDGTIKANIAFGRRGATEDEVRAAAQRAHADEFIERFDRGYDTVIGERGVRLSGGQRQRLAIARAILADPRILILDEATSNLDSESERFIQDSLSELMRGRTSFVIAHRLSTIVDADLILVLDHGRVVESGTHQELLTRDGPYARMVQYQDVTTTG